MARTKAKEIDCTYVQMVQTHTNEVKDLYLMTRRSAKRKALLAMEVACFGVSGLSLLVREEEILATVVICAVCVPLAMALEYLRERR